MNLPNESYVILEPNGGLMCNNLLSVSFQILMAMRFGKNVSFTKYSTDEIGDHDAGYAGGENGSFNHFIDFGRLKIVDSPQEYPEQPNNKNQILIKSSNLLDIFSICPVVSSDQDFRIHPHQFFQESIAAEHIRNNREKIFHKEIIEDAEEGIFVHYRLGDIAGDDRAVHIDHFEKAVTSIANYKILPKYISSDSPEDYRVRKLCDDYGFSIYQSSAAETILFGSKFTNKLISFGTFSWFIGILGSQKNVIIPNRNDYPVWHGDIFSFDDWHELT
tara:strand:- start:597 stop:1421 length:825 start_codon:yes stop_codon:yes gene_type:complete